jgi:hypothetical protein
MPRLPGPPPTAFAPPTKFAQPKRVGPPRPAFVPPPAARPSSVAQRHSASDAFAIDPGRLGLAGGGRPLPEGVRGKMEAALGANFADVRVHVGPQAERIGAIAFTLGSDIYFAPGRYQPDTPHGQQLLGHELAHVVQQRAGRVRNPGSRLAVVQDHALEAEADRMGQRAAAAPITSEVNISSLRTRRPTHPGASPGRTASSLQRKLPEELMRMRQNKYKQPEALCRTLVYKWCGNLIVTDTISENEIISSFPRKVKMPKKPEDESPKKMRKRLKKTIEMLKDASWSRSLAEEEKLDEVRELHKGIGTAAYEKSDVRREGTSDVFPAMGSDELVYGKKFYVGELIVEKRLVNDYGQMGQHKLAYSNISVAMTEKLLSGLDAAFALSLHYKYSDGKTGAHNVGMFFSNRRGYRFFDPPPSPVKAG